MDENLLKEYLEMKAEMERLSAKMKTFEEKMNIASPPTAITPPVERYVPKQRTRPFTPRTPVIKEKRQRNIEGNIGKNLMSILASLLIFIGLVSFVVLIYDNLSELTRFIGMYALSFAFTAVGFWRVSKAPNVFSKSLLSCGIGAVFISIFLSHFYFNYIGELALFGLLIVWSVITFSFYIKLKSSLFIIISYLGFSSALLLGGLSSYGKNLIMFSGLLILQMVFATVMTSDKIEITDKYKRLTTFMTLITAIALGGAASVQFEMRFNHINTLPEIIYLLSVFALVFFNLNIFGKNMKKENQFKYPLLLALGITIANISLVNSIGQNFVRNSYSVDPLFCHLTECPGTIETLTFEPVNSFAFVGLFMFILFILQFIYFFIDSKKIDNKKVSYLPYIMAGISAYCLGAPIFETVTTITGFLIVAIPLLVIFFITKESGYFIMSAIIAGIGSVYGSQQISMTFLYKHTPIAILFVVLSLLYPIIAGIVMKKQTDKKISFTHYISTFFTYIFVSGLFTEYIGSVISGKHTLTAEGILEYNNLEYGSFNWGIYHTLTPIVILLIILAFTCFVRYSGFYMDGCLSLRKLETKGWLFSINNFITLVATTCGAFLLYSLHYSEIIRFLMLIVAFSLCFIGTRDYLNSGRRFAGYVVALKTTFLTNVAINAYLYKYNDISYIYSVVCLLLAITFIVLGFKFKIKSFRFYGLALSLLSVLKLVLIDISYADSISRIISFIVSGLLCFGIVWIYNRMQSGEKEPLNN